MYSGGSINIYLFIMIISVLLVLILFCKYKYKLNSIEYFTDNIDTIIDNKNSNNYKQFYKYLDKFKHRFETINDNEYNLYKLKVVDCVYCITMPERKKYITEKLNSLDINYKLFNAITPKDLSYHEYDNLSYTNDSDYEIYNIPTRLALQMSFTVCFMDAIKNNYKTIMIFEDDIIVNVDLKTLTNSLNIFKKSDYALFYMGYCLMNCTQNFNLENSDILINVPDKSVACAHAICYKVKYLPSLINNIFPMSYNFDNNITMFVKKYKLDICVPSKPYFEQNRIQLGTLNNDDYIGMLPICNIE